MIWTNSKKRINAAVSGLEAVRVKEEEKTAAIKTDGRAHMGVTKASQIEWEIQILQVLCYIT